MLSDKEGTESDKEGTEGKDVETSFFHEDIVRHGRTPFSLR